mmetsp:Transcript_13667/g.33179  ORF Transcript_13667/g.33179 Transcript_13667/m.33179 type:complete len:119 (+) Transcript_13667:1-357(+)
MFAYFVVVQGIIVVTTGKTEQVVGGVKRIGASWARLPLQLMQAGAELGQVDWRVVRDAIMVDLWWRLPALLVAVAVAVPIVRNHNRVYHGTDSLVGTPAPPPAPGSGIPHTSKGSKAM